jgi:hypothetical protein
MTEDLIPIVLFITIGGVFACAFYLKYKARHDVQTTVRAAIDRGESLSPELIETLAVSISSPYADLRKGVISLALGAAGMAFAALLGEEDAMGPLMGMSVFPILIGLAYLGLWFFIGRTKVANGDR